MKRGTIVLSPFPFTDLVSIKRRPAVIVSKYDPKNADLIVAFISSKVGDELDDTDLIIDSKHSDFKKTGLHKTSVIKARKLLTVEKKLLIGEIGILSKRLLNELDQKLKVALGLK